MEWIGGVGKIGHVHRFEDLREKDYALGRLRDAENEYGLCLLRACRCP